MRFKLFYQNKFTGMYVSKLACTCIYRKRERLHRKNTMKRYVFLCVCLALMTSLADNASAQSFGISTNSSFNFGRNNQNNQQMNQNANQKGPKVNYDGKIISLPAVGGVNEANQIDDARATVQPQKTSDDSSYIRQRMEDLERALYQKTKREEAERKKVESDIIRPLDEIKDVKTTQELIDEIEGQVNEEFAYRTLQREIKEKFESNLVLKQFGKDFFVNGDQSDPDLFSDSVPSSYQLGPGDSLKIIVWSEMGDETVYDVQVNPEGQVYIPIIGILGVSGKTVGEFENIVLGKLSGKFNHFKGQVTLSKVRTIQIYVAGEVEKPGAMMVSGLTTAFSALYHAGGPTARGSMRNIRVIEANGRSQEIDLYKYFLSGNRKQDIPIKNGDTIFVPTTEKHITVYGMVSRPAKYEIKGDTKLSEVIAMSGNILPEGYTGRISITRWTGKNRRKSFDVNPNDKNAVDSFMVKPGDEINVERSEGIVENSVKIEGPVHKEGSYSVNDGITVKDLIIMAGGVKEEDVNYKYGLITRKKSNGNSEKLSFNLGKAIEGDPENNIVLKPFDSVKIFEDDEITHKMKKVQIGGAVRNPEKYEYSDGMRVADLVLEAEGLSREANGEVEIARIGEDNKSVIIKADINKALEDPKSKDNVLLQPMDRVNIIANGDKLFAPETVTIKGQVNKPGVYALLYRGEPLSSVIKRAGGLTPHAFADGAVFMRDLKNITTSNQIETTVNVQNELFRIANLDLRADLIKNGGRTESMNEISKDIRGNTVTQQFNEMNEGTELDTSKLNAGNQDAFSKAMEDPDAIIKSRIPIQLAKIISDKVTPEDDVLLMDGDEIDVPMIPQTVSVVGAVMNPSSILFNPNKKVDYYIDRAGGYNTHSDHRRTVIVKANGEVFRLRKVRNISRGDIILVPPKAKLTPKDTLKEISSITQILGNLMISYKVIKDK